MGRTAKDKNVIAVENLKINLISKKPNQYGDEILYFKIVDKDAFGVKGKMKLIKTVGDSTPSLRMPFFTGDNGAVILRIKEKFIGDPTIADGAFEKKTYDANLMFESYCFKPSGNAEDNEISGYLCKALTIKVSDVQSL